ncbi:hypothetical protein ACI3EY_07990 [Ornithinimicrobium sp. LYQ92]|uniref:hypothetical protein n=1 Tax=Serinicoccus sp. LYQ92 TaxID=3378798 RepID=UPI003853BE6B
MPQRLTESHTLTVRESTSDKPARLQLQLIDEGWGSSGYYSSKVLENAATAKVFAKGTKLFFDHPGETERHDRPERSVRDLAAVLAEDATYDPDRKGLVGEATIVGPYRDLLTDETFLDSIGMSIAAYADTTIGEAQGRKGTIVTNLTEAFSVDFVTFPGRGGKVLSVLESARAGRVSEASTEDTRRALIDALRGAYGAEDTWVWVQDFDPDQSLVWFTVESPDDWSTFQQGYSTDDAGAVTLADGDPTQVRARTEYVPVTTTDAAEASPKPPVAPAGSTPTHESPKEDTMPQIEEGRLAQLEADAGRVQTLESERDAATTERDEAREALAARDRTDQARTIITTQAREAGVAFTAMEERGLLAGLPVKDGALDESAYTDTVKEAAAEVAKAAGAGTVRGFGQTVDETDTTNTVTAEESRATVLGAFGMSPKGA